MWLLILLICFLHLHKEEKLYILETFQYLITPRLVDALVKCIVLYDDKLIIMATFRDEPIVIMTSEEVSDVARHGSDIENIAPPFINT